jgi:uncharacterized protein (DUF1800 family)
MVLASLTLFSNKSDGALHCFKLYRYFVREDPSPELVAQLGKLLKSNTTP